MRGRVPQTISHLMLVASLFLLACDLGSVTNTLIGMAGSKPTVTIQSPTAGSVYREGDDVTVQSVSKDDSGIVRVELSVDGASTKIDTPPVPQGQVSFTVVQKWKATAGTHTLSVRAFNSLGTASDPALVTILVSPVSGRSTPLPGSAETATLVVGQPTPIGGASATPTVETGSGTPVSATATRRPTARPAATATIKAAPGVYAPSIRLGVERPTRGQPITFLVTFFNNTAQVQRYRWFVKTYEPDKTNSKGETPKLDSDIPPGTTELLSLEWRLVGPGPCESYNARVFMFDIETKQTSEFIKPDGSGGPAVGFQVCP